MSGNDFLRQDELRLKRPRKDTPACVGIGPRSHEKHFLMGQALRAQAAVFGLKFNGKGLFVDMHAGSGEGSECPQQPLPLPGVVDLMTSKTTAVLCVDAARKYGADVCLCEKNRTARTDLEVRFHGALPTAQLQILEDNLQLTRVDFSRYGWGIILNDPNGPSEQGMEVLQYMSFARQHLDFIISLNEGALSRIDGVGPRAAYSTSPRVRGLYDSVPLYEWMLEPIEWRYRLDRRQVCWTKGLVKNRGYKGRILVVTNYLSDQLRRDRLWETEDE